MKYFLGIFLQHFHHYLQQHVQQYSISHSNGPIGSLEIITDSPSIQLFKNFPEKLFSDKILFHHTETKYLQTSSPLAKI